MALTMTLDVEGLLKPLPPEAASGDDPRESDSFAQMSAEIDKLSSLTAESLPNWSRVEQLASTHLKTQAKDYLVASWLSEAWVRRYELNGLAAGLTLLAGITREHWDTAVPPVKRLRGRRNAIAWWIDRVKQHLEKQTDDDIPIELSEALVGAAKQLDELLAQKDPDADSLLSLISLLQRIPVKPQAPAAPEEQPDSGEDVNSPAMAPPNDVDAAQDTSGSTPSQHRTAASGKPSLAIATSEDTKIEINSLDDLSAVLRPVQDYISLVGPALFSFDHTNPLSIQFTRFAARAHISEMPLATGGQTAISPPAIAILDAFEKISSSKNAEGLIEFCESRVREYPFWIDLDYHSAKGFSALGPSGARMRDTIIDLMLNFLRRMPGIEHFSFSDGTPFAQADTLAWIERCRQERSGQGPADAFGQAKQEANALLSDGKPREAMGLLQEFISGTRSQRDQFRARLVLIEMCLEQATHANPLALVKPLTYDCQRLGLDQWEPELATQAWQLSARAARQGLSSSDQTITDGVHGRYQEALEEAVAHLAALDFEAATKFNAS